MARDGRERALSKLSSAICSAAARFGPLRHELRLDIEGQVFQTLHRLPTPAHPPYASMILRAITELNEKDGSSEKTISAYIVREYMDLPWAHASFLSQHLRKLCSNGEIMYTNKGKYTLLVDSGCATNEPKRADKNKRLVKAVEENNPIPRFESMEMRRKRTRGKGGRGRKITGMSERREERPSLDAISLFGDMESDSAITEEYKTSRERTQSQICKVKFRFGSSCWEYIRKDYQKKGQPAEADSTSAVIEQQTQTRDMQDEAVQEQSHQQKRRITSISGSCSHDRIVTGNQNSRFLDASSNMLMEQLANEPFREDARHQSATFPVRRELICGLPAQKTSIRRVYSKPIS